MKRKYAAIALGLTLALSSTAAFAEESTEPASVEATADEASTEDLTDTSAENTDTFVGQITEITEDTIKIANRQLMLLPRIPPKMRQLMLPRIPLKMRQLMLLRPTVRKAPGKLTRSMLFWKYPRIIQQLLIIPI